MLVSIKQNKRCRNSDDRYAWLKGAGTKLPQKIHSSVDAAEVLAKSAFRQFAGPLNFMVHYFEVLLMFNIY
jgi:hypothetical protein